jgi:hypothetical protein
VWGSTFFLLKDVVERVPGHRLPRRALRDRRLAVWLIAPRSLSRLTAVERRNGRPARLVYGGAQVLQTVGLQSTAASVSGFVTGMYVVVHAAARGGAAQGAHRPHGLDRRRARHAGLACCRCRASRWAPARR